MVAVQQADDWTRDVWLRATTALANEDRRFDGVEFTVEPAGDGSFSVEVRGTPEACALLVTPGWTSVLRGFLRRAACDANRPETRHALENPSWPAFLVTAPGLEVQPEAMERPVATQSPPGAADAAPPSLPSPPRAPVQDPAPAPLRAHPFLESPIPNEDDIVRALAPETPASEKMLRVCLRIWGMLAEKNRAYGNSALAPVRVFSKAPTGEQIRVRLDDKISRLARGQAAGEDVVQDLMGYLVLLKVSELPWPAEK